MRTHLIALAGLGALLVTGCDSDDDKDTDDTDTVDDTDRPDTDDTDDTDVTPTGGVRFLHASPDAPAVSIWAAGERLVDALAYGESTAYLQVPPGTWTFSVCLSLAESCPSPILQLDPVQVTSGDTWTAVLAGSAVAGVGGADGLRALLYENDLQAGAGEVAVRVIHAGIDAPTVTLVAVGIDDDDDDDVVLGELDRFDATGRLLLPAGQAVRVRVEADGQIVTAFTLPPGTSRDAIYLVATGRLADRARQDTGFALLALDAGSQTAFVRQDPRTYLLHASPDAPEIDVWFGQTRLLRDVAFGQLATVQVRPGAPVYDIFPAVEGDERPAGAPVLGTELVLERGEEWLLVATGFLGSQSNANGFRLLQVPIEFDSRLSTNAFAQLVHASPDTPTVDVGIVTSGGMLATPVLQAGLSFGQIGEIREVPPGTHDLGAAVTGTLVPAVVFRDVTLEVRDEAVAVIAGSRTHNPPLPGLRTFVVETSVTPWVVTTVPGQLTVQ